MRPHRYNRRDDNEREIMDCLEKLGATVARIGERNIPDLLVGFQGRTYLLEIKNPQGLNRLSPGQSEFQAWWRGGPIHTVRTVADVEQWLRDVAAV